jgi:molybdenum-dependent DNA-binding transcriptional regulator ModE
MNRTQAKTKIWLINDKEKPIMEEGKAALLKAINEEVSLNKHAGK